MNDNQGKHNDKVYENTLLDDYDHIQIDQEAIEAELKGREQFEQRPGRNIIVVLSGGQPRLAWRSSMLIVPKISNTSFYSQRSKKFIDYY